MSSSAAPQRSPDRGSADISVEARAWFERLWSGRFDDADVRDFIVWHNADPVNAAAFSALEHQAASRSQDSSPRPFTPADTASEIHHDGARHGTVRWIGRAVVVLAVGAVAAGAVIMLEIPQRLAADVVTTTGERRTVPLPDGSKVVLNAESAINLDFADSRRGIDLQAGEAFVEVQPDEVQPFEVTAGRTQVRTTNGSFAVRFQSEDVLYVFVADGTAQVASHTADGALDVFTLRSGSTARITPEGAEPWGRVEGEDLVAWREGRLVLRNEPISAVVEELSRYHRGWIVVASDRLQSARISGEYNLDDPRSVINSLAQATGARVTRLTNNLVVLRCE